MSRIILRLECFHDDVTARQRAVRTMDSEQKRRVQSRHFAHDLRVGTAGTWVAEVTGIDAASGRIQRRFLEGLKDYTDANSVGSRGVYKFYVLTDGKLYEVADRAGYGKPPRRRFCRVEDGRVVTIEIGEVLRCL